MRLTIYKKMMLGFGSIIIIMVLASIYMLAELNDVSNITKTVLTSNVQSVDLAKELQTMLYSEDAYAQKYLITRDDTYFSLFLETSQQVNLCLDSLLKTQSGEKERSIIKGMQHAHELFVASIKGNTDRKRYGPGSENEDTRPDSTGKLHKSLDHFISLKRLAIRNAVSGMEETTSRSAKIALLLISWTLLVAIVLAFVIARTITRPIGDLIRGTERIGRGRFDPVSVSSNDEISLLAHAINDMSLNIKKINDLRTQMMQQISHELQNPLQAILAAHDILKSSNGLDTRQTEMLDKIRNGVDELARFSRQYLDLAKAESGMMKYCMVRTDLLQIVKPVVEEMKLVAARKDITVELTAIDSPHVMVDADKIGVVVRNLLSNAIKYTRADGKIGVNIAPCDLGVRLEVSDTGIGIIPEELSQVFTRFYRASNAGIIKSRGTGVGLALVKAFTEGHGGRVYAESTVNRGSKFVVELPSAQEEAQDSALIND